MSKEVKQYIDTLQKRIAHQRAEIKRLRAVIEKLIIKCNAWHLAAERVGEELQVARANAETLDILLKHYKFRNSELTKTNEALAKQCEEFEAELYQAHNIRTEVAMEIFEEIERLHLHITNEFDLQRYNELKKKYLGEQE